jgi:hypothetical protein
MSSPVTLKLFEFVDEFAGDVRAKKITALQTVAGDDKIVIFSEGFFDQYFANVLEQPIRQFSAASKRAAGQLAEELRSEGAATRESRALIALFEDFCDMYGELINGSYGAGNIAYRDFCAGYLSPLLEDVETWAKHAGEAELLARVQAASRVEREAVSAAKW